MSISNCLYQRSLALKAFISDIGNEGVSWHILLSEIISKLVIVDSKIQSSENLVLPGRH